MSGVFGVIDSKRKTQIPSLLDRMGRAMSHRPWFEVSTYCSEEEGIGLGKIGIGIFNKEPQPEIIGEIGLLGFFSGELFDTPKLSRDLQASGHALRNGSDLELVLRLYQHYGEQFIELLNGAFFLVIWDRKQEKMLIGSDRFGLYPHYYALINGRLVFSPEVKGILSDPYFDKELDLTALAECVRFQHLLGEKTFFTGINVFPNASLMTCNLSRNTHKIWQYWTPDQIPFNPDIDFNTAVEEAGRLLRRAVERRSSDAHIPGVYLSGGLDSRTILGLIEKRPVVTMTYGQRDCLDVRIAEKVAKSVGSDHHWFDLENGEWVNEFAEFHLKVTEGFHSWIHSHGISTLTDARILMDVNLTGWGGGTVMGHRDSIEPLQIHAVDDFAFINRLYYLFNQKFTWPSITGAEERLLYHEAIQKEMMGLAFDSFREEITRYLDYRRDIRGELFYLRNHCGRLTQNLVTFTRSHIEVRFPYFDYELFDFLYSLPAEIRGHKKLYRAVCQREIPRLTYIPYANDARLPTTRAFLREPHNLLVRVKYRVNKHIFPIFRTYNSLYADYEEYLRYELRDWGESILFDPRTEERGIFNLSFLRSLMDRHLSGHEEWTIGKIAPIITYEMMLRELYDG